MFIVKDCTRNPPYTTASNDIKDVRDIVIGIPEMKRLVTMSFFILDT